MNNLHATSIPDVIDQLVSIANTLDNDVDAYHAAPMGNVKRTWMAVSDIREGRNEYATMKAGRKNRDEFYLVEFIVSAVSGGKSSRPAIEKCMTLWGGLCEAIATDPKIGLQEPWPNMVVSPGGFEMFQRMESDSRGWRVELQSEVKVRNRV